MMKLEAEALKKALKKLEMIQKKIDGNQIMKRSDIVGLVLYECLKEQVRDENTRPTTRQIW